MHYILSLIICIFIYNYSWLRVRLKALSMYAHHQIKQYLVMGRAKPKKENDQPTIYRMRVFAPNEVVARSKFFNLLSYQKKLKRSNAELLATQEILEAPSNSVKNYGIAFRYHSRTAIHNMYKEYRATT